MKENDGKSAQLRREVLLKFCLHGAWAPYQPGEVS